MGNNLAYEKKKEKNMILGAIKVLRPVHWVKNLSMFAAIIFAGQLFEPELFRTVAFSCILFCIISSCVYIINDIVDAPNDRNHPIKKKRPIASGQLPVSVAIIELIGLVTIALTLSVQFQLLFFALSLYFIMQIGYSFGLKNIPVIDILIIAAGFILRVYAGAFVIDAHLSVWFLLCVISSALFLAAGKRRAELGVVGVSGETRKSLSKYSTELLNTYVTMFGNSAWMSWALYTFYESPRASKTIWLLFAELSRATAFNKMLMTTIPVTIFAIMRYQSLIFQGRSEAPEKLLLTDKALITSIGIWLVMVIGILYSGITG